MTRADLRILFDSVGRKSSLLTCFWKGQENQDDHNTKKCGAQPVNDAPAIIHGDQARYGNTSTDATGQGTRLVWPTSGVSTFPDFGAMIGTKRTRNELI